MEPTAQDLLLRELRDNILQLNMMLKKQADEFRAMIAERDAQIAALTQELANKQEQLDYFQAKYFGKSSEKHKAEDPNQLTIYDVFNEVEKEADPTVTEPEAEEKTVVIKEHTRRKKSTFEEKYGDLPREKVVHPGTDEALYCDTCGTQLVQIGEKFVRREIQVIPRQVKIIEHYVKTYKCPKCEAENDTQYKDQPYITTADAPAPLIQHSMASASMVAMIIYLKYISSVPLCRQEQLWKQEGLDLSRATMANWVITCAQEYFSIMYQFFRRCLIDRRFLMADETTVQVLKEPDRSPESTSYMWLFRSGEDGLPPILLYEYRDNRRGQNAVDFLEGFAGYLETDGYAGYNKLDEGIIRCCCWAHVRRKFWEAIPAAQRKQPDMSLPAAQGFEYIQKLFAIEKAINERADFSYEKRHDLRLQKEKPILEAFWTWAEKQVPVKGSKFCTAIKYALNRKTELMNYLQDGHCSLHNNATEHLAKSFALGRKNWMFSDTPNGAEASAICYSIVEMAKANNINPFKYLKFLLERRPNKDMSDMELSRLAPWDEDIRKACTK